MDENQALIQVILREEAAEKGYTAYEEEKWQTVTYKKRGKKPPSGIFPNSGSVSQWVPTGAKWGDYEDDDDDVGGEVKPEVIQVHGEDEDEEDDGIGSSVVEKKVNKNKKKKKPKVTVAQAAAKIDPSDLAAFLADRTDHYEIEVDEGKDSEQEREKKLNLVLGIADYFGRAFAAVGSSQFPWMKLLDESSVAKMEDIPLSHISEDVYKTAAEWLKGRSPEALNDFVVWSLDSILADLAIHHKSDRGSKKVVQRTPSRSQVAIFVVLAITLRRKPDVMISVLPTLKDDVKYQGQDKLPVIVWMITQACQGDLVVGLYMWIRLLLPYLTPKSSCSSQSRDLILQFVERALSAPKARSILLNGAVRKGERLVPPSALDLLMRSSFPAPSSRVKDTERVKGVYPTLKEIALAGSPGSKAMKQITEEIMQLSLKAAGDGVVDLSKEASNISIWCLTQNPDCYKQLDASYLDNLEASVILLRKLASEWKEHSVNHAFVEPLGATLKSLRDKTGKALGKGDVDVTHKELLKEAEKHCKALRGHLSKSNGYVNSMVIVSVALVVGAAAAFMSADSGLKKIFLDFNF